MFPSLFKTSLSHDDGNVKTYARYFTFMIVEVFLFMFVDVTFSCSFVAKTFFLIKSNGIDFIEEFVEVVE
jgi:hypothetical protein